MKKKWKVKIILLAILMGGYGGLGIVEPNVYADLEEEILEEDEAEEEAIKTEIYIKAVNPGYTIDGEGNVGEMIEIGRKNAGEMTMLAGLTIGYTNSSGNYMTIFEFPEESYMTGESIILRLASAPESELSAANYTKTLAMKGGIDLKNGERMIDSVCWTGKDECYREFKTTNPTSLVRNLETGEFEHIENYVPNYVEGNYIVKTKSGEEETKAAASQCRGVVFSEILSYYETLKSEQFIEVYNTNSEQVRLDGCSIKYKNKMHALSGVVEADGYLAYYPSDFNLTKNPTNSNTLELIDTDGATVDSLTYRNGQRKGTAYMFSGYDGGGEEVWLTTYAPTPGAPNNYQEYKTCEAGKVINEATGNCVKATLATEKVCQEGQYLNVLTGRCKKYATLVSAKTCKEGYYLNEATGRCRKVVENDGVEYGIEPENYEESSSFIGLWAALGVVALGGGYLIYEYRREIVKFFRRA